MLDVISAQVMHRQRNTAFLNVVFWNATFLNAAFFDMDFLYAAFLNAAFWNAAVHSVWGRSCSRDTCPQAAVDGGEQRFGPGAGRPLSLAPTLET